MTRLSISCSEAASWGSWVTRSDRVSTARSSVPMRRCDAASSAAQPGKRPANSSTCSPPSNAAAQVQDPGDIDQQPAADSAAVMLDQIEVGRRNIRGFRQFRLLQTRDDAPLADAASGQGVACHQKIPYLQHLSATQHKSIYSLRLHTVQYLTKKLFMQKQLLPDFRTPPHTAFARQVPCGCLTEEDGAAKSIKGGFICPETT